MNKIILILITIVLVGIAGFALLWFGVGGKVQEEAEAVLRQWQDGKAADIYREADSKFREGQSYEDFEAYLAYWKTRRGAFEAVEKRINVSASLGARGTREVTLLLRFARGPAHGYFLFSDDYGLMQISIREPPQAVEKSDVVLLEKRAHSLFMEYNEKNYVGLYAALSPELQMVWRPAAMRKQLDTLHVRAGRIDENFSQSVLKDEDDGDKRVVGYDIKFERGPGTAKITFHWDDEHWRVTGFLLDFPQG